MVLARGFVKQNELAKAIDEIRPTLHPDVVRLTYVLGEDWSGDAAISFRLVLADEVGERIRRGETVQYLRDAITRKLKPLEEWGLLPYFSIRTESEQARSSDDTWPVL